MSIRSSCDSGLEITGSGFTRKLTVCRSCAFYTAKMLIDDAHGFKARLQVVRRGLCWSLRYTESAMSDTRQRVHELIDRLPSSQLTALDGLLESMLDSDSELTEEDRRAVAASREYFRSGGEGTSFEQIVSDCGFDMDQIRNPKSK